MNKHLSSAELKARAKSQLLGKYGTLIPMILVVEAIMSVLTSMTSAGMGPHKTWELVLQFVITLALQVFAGILVAGQAYVYLNVACGGNVRLGDVFYVFKNKPDRAILIQLFQLILMLICFLPCLICLGIFAATDSMVLLLPLSITLCIGMAAGVIVLLQYSQSYYVMLDFPELSARECLRFSREIMKGNKGRRFYLEISFIPLGLLGILSCCVGLLFLIPYMNTTYTNFYLELMSRRDG